MNNNAILFHLVEAKQELLDTIEAIETNPNYEFGKFCVGMRHLYHHLNTAWNGKDASAKRHHDCSQEDFDAWERFPSNELLDGWPAASIEPAGARAVHISMRPVPFPRL